MEKRLHTDTRRGVSLVSNGFGGKGALGRRNGAGVPGLAFCLLLALTLPARADQAAWVTKQQAERAQEILSGRKEIRNFCEPCGDTAFTSEAVKNPSVVKQDDEHWSVANNGNELDLAYVYVEVRGVWVNLAKLVGAPVEDVSAVLPTEPMPRLSDDMHLKLLQSSPEYKAADERLNKAWKAAVAVVPPKDKTALESEQRYWLGARYSQVLNMRVNHKRHMPVPVAALRDGAVDAAKAYAALAQSRAFQLEAYVKSLKTGPITLTGVLTEGGPGGGYYLHLDDNVTWFFLCTREDQVPEALEIPYGSRVRVTAALESLIKFTCDKDMKVETLAQPVKKSGKTTSERASVIGALGDAPVPGRHALTVVTGPMEDYAFNENDENAAECADEAKAGDLIEVTGTLVTPAEGPPYFDPEAPTRCGRLVP